MGSGGGSQVDYQSSPEARAMMAALMPTVMGLYGKGIGDVPTTYGASGPGPFSEQIVSGLREKYGPEPTPQQGPGSFGVGDVLGYNIPSVQNLMPTSGWYQGIAPEVKAGLREPYMDAHQRIMEQMNMRGQFGGSGGGISPAAAAFSGEFAAQMGQGMGMQAWQMTQPALNQQYQAELQRNMLMKTMPYSLLPGFIGQGMPQPVVSPAGPGAAGTMANMGAGALAGYGATGNPWGAAAGGAIGLLGSFG
jgi:hypothetical protein